MTNDQKVQWKNVKKLDTFNMDILKIATAGSVDDGKSTLIGRLLYETDSLKSDQLEHIKVKSELRGFDYLDLSLATDGLLTEREQGITIDVSHIFFSTPTRRFIIADSPGHVEYTRNMVTGASTAQASILLLDARKGMVEQTICTSTVCSEFNIWFLPSIKWTSSILIKIDMKKLKSKLNHGCKMHPWI
jgi:sulfate adenylyltransferase subunit 1 (EFTu-like GTPase family)